LGAPHKATGTPLVVAMIDLIGAPVSFPEAEQGAQAAIAYVNGYLDGINNHPIVLKECSNTTLAAPASATCANELVADNPTLVLGAADTGAAGAFPIWQAHHLAYVGGSSFTPVESNATNSVIFTSLALSDNAAPLAYAAHTLHIKSVAIIEANDTQGLASGAVIENVANTLGMTHTQVPLSDTASTSDFAAAAAQAESSNPGLIYVEAPSECVQTVLALKQTGYAGKLAGVGPCAAPPAIAAMGAAANGFFFGSPQVGFDQSHTKQWGQEIAITEAALAKYAPKNIALDAPALDDFGAVMNLRTTLDAIKGKLTEKSIIGAFEKGSNHPNWLAHPYTCNRKQVPTQASVCNPYEQLFQVNNGAVATLTTKWVNGAQYYKPTG
jgi:branched-chain amino acid transport system substrate-binding protein